MYRGTGFEHFRNESWGERAKAKVSVRFTGLFPDPACARKSVATIQYRGVSHRTSGHGQP
jgi:hypothetical protein